MAGPPIRIKVGAAMDSSVERVFAAIENRARRTARLVQQSFAGGSDLGKAGETVAKGWQKATEKMQRSTRKVRDDAFKSFQEIGRVAEREMNRAARAQFNAQQRAGQTLDRFATRTSHRTTRFMTPNTSFGTYAARTAGDLARGIGIDLSAGSSMQRNIALNNAAIGLAQQERIATGGKTQGASQYESIARTQGAALGIDPTQIVEMMRAFTGKTGEFEKIGDVVARLAPQAVASGTGFQEMGDAAGFFYNQVKHLPNALELTEQGMRAIIGQTAVGSVEMPDFAKQMGRIAASAPKFAGTREHVIAQSAALAQLAIESGGATSAADAARSVGAFGDTFGKAARIKAFRKHHVELFTNPGTGPGKNTQLRDQFDIIKDAIRETKGNVPELADMFASTLGRKPVQALVSKYTDAGGGAAGMKAVDEALQKYMSTTMSADAQQKNVAEHLASTAGKVASFQVKLDTITAQAGEKLLPALEKLEPVILKLADTFGNVATWAVENPKEAIAAGIGLSIARAGIESIFRTGIEAAITRGAAALGIGGAVPTAVAAGESALPAAGLAAGAGFLAPTVLGKSVGAMGALGAAAAAYLGVKLADDQNDQLKKESGGLGALDIASEWFKTGKNPFEIVNEHQNAQAKEEARKRGTFSPSSITGRNEDANLMTLFGDQKKALLEMKKEIAGLRNGTLNVKVTNQIELPPDMTGRQSQQ